MQAGPPNNSTRTNLYNRRLCPEGLEEARRALEFALEELEECRRDREVLRIRNACEKDWLAVVPATDASLVSSSYREPESYSERRRALEEIEREIPGYLD